MATRRERDDDVAMVPLWFVVAMFGSVHGTVRDAKTGEPLVGATVVVEGRPFWSAMTDEHGEYRIDWLPRGTYRLSVDYADTGVMRWIEVAPPADLVIDETLGTSTGGSQVIVIDAPRGECWECMEPRTGITLDASYTKNIPVRAPAPPPAPAPTQRPFIDTHSTALVTYIDGGR